ncbi:MAG: Gfo/Idh/MocA family oxidoreductase [Proteobacteria bacterium]|nr:Gfo/Idh/MocA family oxidoreductase [Pseudomonadota bacterium]
MASAPVRLALIGAGRWGRAYIRTIAASEGVALVRLASRNPEARALVGPEVAIDADWRTLIAAEDIDGVIVAAPPAAHFAIARAAILAGRPALVEKPLALSAGEARELLSLARARRALVMVDHTYLFHPAWAALKRRAATLGEVRAIRAAAGNWGPFRGDVSVLWDWGPHDLAMLLDLLGRRPVALGARREPPTAEAPPGGETVRLSLAFPGGVAAEARLSNVLKPKTRRFEVRFSHRALVFDGLARHPLTEHPLLGDALGEGTPLAVERELPLARAVRAFANAIRLGSAGRASLALGVKVVEILAALEATLTGASPCAA